MSKKSDHEDMLRRLGAVGNELPPPLDDAGPALPSNVIDGLEGWTRQRAQRDRAKIERQEAALAERNRKRDLASAERRKVAQDFLNDLRGRAKAMLDDDMLRETEVSLEIPLSTLKDWVNKRLLYVPPARK